MDMQIALAPLCAQNMDRAARLRVADCQTAYVPDTAGIFARAWTYRAQGAALYVILASDAPVGLMLVYELEEAPACYCLMEMMVDRSAQGRGVGSAALKLLIEKYSAAPRFPAMELAVHRENLRARRVYEKAGFVDSGYVDPALPQYVNMVYRF